MADFNFIAVIIGHPRFTCQHALDLLDFILDISVSNLIFSKSANMLLNLIFSMKLLIKNKSVFEQAQTIFKDYIIQMLTLYITNLKSNVIDNTILEVTASRRRPSMPMLIHLSAEAARSRNVGFVSACAGSP